MSTKTHTHTLKQRMQSNISLVQKTVILTLAACMLGFIVVGAITYLYLYKAAEQYSQQSLQAMSKQIAQVSSPMILRHDLISLNIILQQLVDDNLITGASITSSDDTLLAQAGITQTLHLHTVPIYSGDLVLGELQLQTPPFILKPSLFILGERIWPWALVGLMLSWMLGWWFGLRLIQPLRALHDAQENISIYGHTVPLDDRRYDEWAIVNAGFNFINESRLLHNPQNQMEINMVNTLIKESIQLEDTRIADSQKFNTELYDLAQELSSEPNDHVEPDETTSSSVDVPTEIPSEPTQLQEKNSTPPKHDEVHEEDKEAKATIIDHKTSQNTTQPPSKHNYIRNIQAKKIGTTNTQPFNTEPETKPTNKLTVHIKNNKLVNDEQNQYNDPLMQPVETKSPSPTTQTVERNRVMPVLTMDDLKDKPSNTYDVLMDQSSKDDQAVNNNGINEDTDNDKQTVYSQDEHPNNKVSHADENEGASSNHMVEHTTFDEHINTSESPSFDATATQKHLSTATTEPQGEQEQETATPTHIAKPGVSVLYININTREQRLLDNDTKTVLFNAYHELAQDVLSIYKGTLQIQQNQDILVVFDQPQEGLTHCMNAICAGLFFIGMSQAYKLKQITQRKPTLKMQLVVHTGKFNEIDELTQFAVAMSQQQRLDDLMISRQVAYHPELQTHMIDMNNCTQLSNGAFALIRLPEDHQVALSKQVHHYAKRFNT